MRLSLCLFALTISGCTSLTAPSSEMLAQLPVVEFPAPPPAGDFVYKLPAGKPIPTRMAIEGDLLATPVEEVLTTSLKQDLYIHKRWVSEDGRHWRPASEVVHVNLALALPSDEHPKPGEVVLSVNRKAGQ